MKPIKWASWLLLIAAVCIGAVRGQTPDPDAEKKVFADVEKRAKQYIELRKKADDNVPKASKDATPEQISAYKTALLASVQTARNGAKQGDIFTPAAASLLRSVIKSEFKGYERAELRKTVLEADTKGVPLRVNYPYPESKELVAMSPDLLLRLPQLPKELRYRYVGRSLVIMDRDNSLIVDFMKEALP